MERFTGADRAFCVREYYKNKDSASVAQKMFIKDRALLDPDEAPSVAFIREWVKKFEETGSTVGIVIKEVKRKGGTPRTVTSDENIALVRQSLIDHPDISTLKRAELLNINTSAIRRIIKIMRGIKPNKNYRNMYFK